MVVFHNPPLDIDVEIYVAIGWAPVPTADIRQDNGITIRAGRQREGVAMPDPAEATFTAINTSGDYDPDNPEGQYYGKLGLNTPVRIYRGLDTKSFGGSVSSGWADTDQGHVFSTASVGGTISGTDYSETGGVGKHSVPAANATRMTYLNGEIYEKVEVACAIQFPFSTVTGASLGGQIALRGQSSTSFYKARLTILGTDVVASIRDPSDVLLDSVTVSWAHTGQKIRMRAQVEGQTIRLRIWQDGDLEPYFWTTQVHDASITVAGFVGLQTFVSTGNTNAKPIIASWDDLVIRSPRFFGEIVRYQPGWDTTSRYAYVDITAMDVLRRLGKGGSLLSSLRRGLSNSANLRAYWPCEDGDKATGIASAIPGHQPGLITGTPDYASYSGFDASLPIPLLKLSGWVFSIPDYTNTGEIQTTWIMHIPSGGTVNNAIMCQTYTAGTAGLWEVIYGTGGTVSLKVWSSAGVVLTTFGPFAFNLNDKKVRFFLQLTQNGSNVDWLMAAPEAGSTGTVGFNSGTLNSQTIGGCFSIRLGPGLLMDDVAIGHVALHDSVDSIFDLQFELNAWAGETGGARAQRLLEQEGYTFGYIGDLATTELMGIAANTTLKDNLDECVNTDQGTLRAACGALELIYRTRASMYAQAAAVTLTLSAGELADPFDPVRDDDTIRNYVIVTAEHGGSAVAALTTGRLSTQQPPDGIGKYDSPASVNTYSDDQLPYIAQWTLAQSTVDDRRFPALGIDLASRAVSADLVLSRQILDLDIDDRLVVDGASSRNVFEPISQLVRGYTETLSTFEHRFTCVTIPEAPYAVGMLDDTSFRLDSDSELENAITNNQTTFTVKLNDTQMWTESGGDFPFDILVGGERMTVTGITSTAPTFVGVGTAAHANNANVVPGLPASVATGHEMLVFAAIRGGSATVSVPGYTNLLTLGNVSVYGKPHSGSESAPTVTVSGGVAGDSVSAQMCAFANLPNSLAGFSQQFNGTSQNVTFPAYGGMRAESMLVYAMFKEDDFTSVATLSGLSAGATEIGEFSTTLGNDQGLAWDYQHIRGEVAVATDAFVVTGGTAQNSRGMVLHFGTWQTFTVTRSVNGVVKSHTAGTKVHPARPFRLGL